MRKVMSVSKHACELSLIVLGSCLMTRTASAEAVVKEGRSVAACSQQELVCAIMKDGTMKPTSECQARQDGAVRVLPGDCYDAD